MSDIPARIRPALLAIAACSCVGSLPAKSSRPVTAGPVSLACDCGGALGDANRDGKAAATFKQQRVPLLADLPSSSGERSAPPALPDRDSSPFHLAVRGSFEMSVEHQGRRLVAAAGYYGERIAGGWTTTCVPEPFALHSGHSLWFARRSTPRATCPEQATLVESTSTGLRTAYAIGAHHLLTARWGEGRTLAAVVPRRTGPPWGYELRLIEGKGYVPKPSVAPPKEGEPRCYSRLQHPFALAAFDSGAVVVVGEGECPSAESDSVLVERWTIPRAESQLTRLPLASIAGFVGVSADDLWFVGTVIGSLSKALVHFDGAGFSLLPQRFDQEVSGLAVDAGGKRTRVLVLGNDQLWVWTPSQAQLDTVAIPELCTTPRQIWVESDAWWLGCEEGIFTTNEVEVVFEWPQLDPECATMIDEPRSPLKTLDGTAAERLGCGPQTAKGLVPAAGFGEGATDGRQFGF